MIFAKQTYATNTKDRTFYTPVAETICITEPKGLTNAGRMLTSILKHQLLMAKLKPDAPSTPFPNQVNEKTHVSFPVGAAGHEYRAAADLHT